jgi:hypothetical protein
MLVSVGVLVYDKDLHKVLLSEAANLHRKCVSKAADLLSSVGICVINSIC